MSLDLSSTIHFSSCFFRHPAFTSDSNAFKYLEIALEGGRSDKLLILSGRLLDEIAKSKSIECRCCTALFFKWRGSTTSLSQRLPIKGSNSCLEFLFAMDRVILVLCVDFARVGGRLSLNFKTCLPMFSLCLYGHGFHCNLELCQIYLLMTCTLPLIHLQSLKNKWQHC